MVTAVFCGRLFFSSDIGAASTPISRRTATRSSWSSGALRYAGAAPRPPAMEPRAGDLTPAFRR
jgi:hypothetical protein